MAAPLLVTNALTAVDPTRAWIAPARFALPNARRRKPPRKWAMEINALNPRHAFGNSAAIGANDGSQPPARISGWATSPRQARQILRSFLRKNTQIRLRCEKKKPLHAQTRAGASIGNARGAAIGANF
ncbi:hypothetical protein B0H13DRAFT_1900611 [Mycena leptocephala]|nr:hypothetical protein B0H13DRAFT_1900611 [Mycena leptocephala]